MAEPARSPYDEEPEDSGIRPNLHVVGGGGETTPERGDLRAVPSEPEDEAPSEDLSAPSRGGLRVLEGGKGKEGTGGEGGTENGSDTAGRTLDANALKDAESREGSLYNPGGGQDKKTKTPGRFRGLNRRRGIMAGLGAGGISGLMFAIFVVGPIYRIPALMTQTGNKVDGPMDSVVANRAQREIVLYLLNRAAAADLIHYDPNKTILGHKLSDIVVTGSLRHDVWRTFQSNRLEVKIKKQLGISFEQDRTGKVHLIFDNEAGYRDLGEVKNADEVFALIDKGTIDTKRDFRTIVDSIVPARRLFKASKLAKAYENRFLKRPFGAPPEDKDPKKTAEERDKATADSLAPQELETGASKAIEVLPEALDCLEKSQNCDVFDSEDPNATLPDPNSDTAQRESANGSGQEVADTIKEASDEAKKDPGVLKRTKTFIDALIEKILTKLIGEAGAKFATTFIPFVGPIDTLATLQHALGTALSHDLVHTIPVYMRELAYGSIYSNWQGYSSQEMAGKMPLSQVAVLNKQLAGSTTQQGAADIQRDQTASEDAKNAATAGIESDQAATYKYLQDGTIDKGIPVNPKVGSNLKHNGNDFMNEVYNNLAVRLTIRGPLEAWYYTVGALLRGLSTLGSEVVSVILRGIGFEAAQNAVMRQIFGDDWKKQFGIFAMKAIINLFGIAVDAMAQGGRLVNNIFTGGEVAANWGCKTQVGCHEVTPKQSAAINLQLQREADEEMAMTPLKDRLFSVYTPNSLASALVNKAPMDMRPTSVVASLFSQVAQLPHSLLSAFSPKVRAADITNQSMLTGVQMYGVTKEELDQPTAPEVEQQPGNNIQCPQTDSATQFNVCMADSTVLKAMSCQYVDCPDFNR